MAKADKANINKTIEYRIDSINIIKHTQKHFSEYGLKSFDIKNGECQIGIDIRIESNKSCIAIPMKVVMSMEHEDNKYELVSTEAVYTYRIKKFKSLFITNELDEYIIPDAFMRTLIGTALGGMRGIMVALTNIAEYKSIILPLVETAKLLEEVKKGKSEMKSSTKPSVKKS